jgi:hypothetical protein
MTDEAIIASSPHHRLMVVITITSSSHRGREGKIIYSILLGVWYGGTVYV